MTNNISYGVYSRDATANMIGILAKQKKGVQICHINAQSLRPKIDEFRWIFQHSNVDIICVSETWLDQSTPDGLISLQGYKIFRSDRPLRCGGGVAIYVRNGITCKFCCKSESNDKIEHLFLEILSSGNKMLVGCVYRPNNSIEFTSFVLKLETLIMRYNDISITGDFNSNLLVDSSLKDSMESLGLTPVNIITPTHFTKSNSTLLDLIFVGDRSKVLLYDQLSASCFSKHDLVFVAYNFALDLKDQSYTYRDFKNINYDLLYEHFLETDWETVYHLTSANDQLIFLEGNIVKLYDETVVLKTRNIKAKDKPWFTASVRDAIQKRNIAYLRWKRFRTVELKTEFRLARKLVNHTIKYAKSDYYAMRFGSALSSSKTWKTIREIGVGKNVKNTNCSINANELNHLFANIPSLTTDSSVSYDYLSYNNNIFTEQNRFEFACVTQRDVYNCCNLIKSNAVGHDNIHPKFLRIILPLILPHITHLINTIITTSSFPVKWKLAKIIPIPKSNTEYRPIAILSFLSKVLEKILYQQLNAYIHDRNLLSDRQSGFRSNHSCITALIDVSETLRRELDDGKVNFLVLLDHSKAFDTVDHKLLCTKLKHLFNFSSTSTQLISSYLTGRSQYVHVDNTSSNPLDLTRGVPQGSILGPLLFSIYINDLPQYISYCNVQMYADDVQLYISSPFESVSENVDRLNNDLQNIYCWATANGLSINPRKSKCMLIHKKTISAPVHEDIFINTERIGIVKTAKNLGIVFNSRLNWSDHINTLVGQIYTKLRALWSVQYFTPLNVRILLAKAYLVPNLAYGCELFSNSDSKSMNKLKILYNNIVRYVYGLSKRDHISFYSKSIFGVSFENFLNIRVLIFFHRIIYTGKPKYLFDQIRFSKSSRGKTIILPKFRCLVSEWQFFIYAVRLWNALPHKQQTNSNANSFKTFLFNHFA